MALKRIDWFLTVMALAMASVSAFFLWWKPLYKIASMAETDQIASFEKIDVLAKRRGADSLAWQNAREGSPLAAGDEVFTDKYSGATIKFTNGRALILAEETLIRMPDTQREIILEEGSITPTLSAGDPDLNIQVSGKKMTFKAQDQTAKLNITTSKNGTRIRVLQGKAEMAMEGMEQKKLDQKKSLVIKNIKNDVSLPEILEQIQIFEPVLPSRLEKTEIREGDQLNFSWHWTGKIDNQKTALLWWKMGNSREGKNSIAQSVILTKEQIEQSMLSLPAWKTSGILHWTISLSDKIPAEDEFFSSDIQVIEPPQFYIEHSQVTLLPQENSINLPIISRMGPPFLVRVKNADDESWLSQDEIMLQEFKLEVSQAGRWIVSLAHLVGKEWQYSLPKEINVSFAKMPGTPTTLNPRNDEKKTIYAKSIDLPFIWSSDCQDCDQHVLEYKIESEPVSSINLSGAGKANLSLVQSGDYEWRVKSGKHAGQDVLWSEWSEWSGFNVKLVERPTLPKSGAVFELDRPGDNVHFAWNTTIGATSYRLQLSNDRQFQELILEADFLNEEGSIAIKSAGTYYWRIKAITHDGQEEFSTVNEMTVRPSPPPEAPQLELKQTVPLQWQEVYIPTPLPQKILKQLMDFLIAEARAEWKSFIELKWPVIFRAKKYLFQLCTDESCQTILRQDSTVKNSITIKDLDSKIFYWRVAVIDEWDQQSAFSNVAQIEVVKSEQAPLSSNVEYKFPKAAQSFEDTSTINFDWHTSDHASQFLFELANNLEFENPLKKITTKDKKVEVSPLPAGIYYWRVTATGPLNDTKQGLRRKLIVYKKIEKKALLALEQAAEVQTEKPKVKMLFVPDHKNSLRLPLTIGPLIKQTGYKATGPTHEADISGLQMQGLWIQYDATWWSTQLQYLSATALDEQTFSDHAIILDVHYPWELWKGGRPIASAGARSLSTIDNSTLSRRTPRAQITSDLYIFAAPGWQLHLPWSQMPQHFTLSYRIGQTHGLHGVWELLINKWCFQNLKIEFEKSGWDKGDVENSNTALTLKLGLIWPK